ncbi:MAG TPA: cytochrome b/b6 domain-containing protein, partial [Steroidobacteraceae bacterium]|nr:cytochrome b/b6 domain-containing protein [Steroidobacteraceae bacterium]
MTDSHYTRTAVGLHWAVAGLVFAALFMGWTMTSMAVSPLRLKVYNWHKWVGVTVLTLALLR